MKKILCLVLTFILLFGMCLVSFAENGTNSEAESNLNFDVEAKSAVLMEASTGNILYSKNRNASLPPASVTKIMTILLAMEALEDGLFSLTDSVSVSANAASMGGSQVFLKEGEKMTVEDLLKCTIIASANDAAVALAELVSGNEEEFVRKMNARAMELGMKSACFENVTGLDDTVKNHTLSAMDIAIMSRELMKHELVTKYSSIWQDTIRNGAFTLTNTNRLVRFYDGCNGLKTGSTDKAGYCMSATAKRGNMQLIAVVMGAETRDKRNAIAKTLLDYGFSKYALFEKGEEEFQSIDVLGGVKEKTTLYSSSVCAVVNKNDLNKISAKYNLPEKLSAAVKAMEEVGKIEYYVGEEKIGESILYSKEDIPKITFLELYGRMIGKIFLSQKQ